MSNDTVCLTVTTIIACLPHASLVGIQGPGCGGDPRNGVALLRSCGALLSLVVTHRNGERARLMAENLEYLLSCNCRAGTSGPGRSDDRYRVGADVRERMAGVRSTVADGRPDDEPLLQRDFGPISAWVCRVQTGM